MEMGQRASNPPHGYTQIPKRDLAQLHPFISFSIIQVKLTKQIVILNLNNSHNIKQKKQMKSRELGKKKRRMKGTIEDEKITVVKDGKAMDGRIEERGIRIKTAKACEKRKWLGL